MLFFASINHGFRSVTQQLEKDTRSDTEMEETGSEDEKIIERPVSNNNLTSNSQQQQSQQTNATNARKKKKL